METIKITKWEYLSSRDIYYIKHLEDFERLVAGAYELPNGTLIADTDIVLYVYEPENEL